ncbi:uncharacterized protein EKO05_0001936 [Ascochyta rabiei]|uniref:Uncharacterized protein n=1 Tax=Didymella rabiei TaxID=5454 RepID=A0A163I2W4_DIDRA|nr:uncharacterized protein EKO05_0001936 [Ascochyta rabiei]KZM25580.1 hypothetical protein ST47_g3317 [Ascochyta rabiei]UPX11328.1 hypothetical protein EKO05_0001936 [Ascochyta rabiei]
MFKAQVLRRSFSLFNRVPTSRIVQSAARHGHETITIHRVRIQKPFFSRQRLVGAVAVTAATYGLGQYLGLEIEIEEEEKEEAKQKPGRWKKQVRKEDGSLEEVDDEEANEEQDEEGDEDEYDDAILFLPTGFSRRKPHTFYKGSDPEWQEFKNIIKDKKRVERIRQELVDTVRTTVSKSAYAARIGQVDHKKGRAWIEFNFPNGPPSAYERPGYELTEDLEWRKATRPVEPVHHHRLAKLFYPTAAAAALYQDTKRKAKRSWNDFAVYMGLAEKTEPHALQQLVQQTSNPLSPTSPGAPPANATSPTPFGTSLPAAPQQSAAQSSPPVISSAKDPGLTLPDPKALILDLGKFRQDFQKVHKGAFQALPPGVFAVLALVEVYGSKARLTLNVTGVYDPKHGRYVALKCDAWNLSPHRQAPKGGP